MLIGSSGIRPLSGGGGTRSVTFRWPQDNLSTTFTVGYESTTRAGPGFTRTTSTLYGNRTTLSAGVREYTVTGVTGDLYFSVWNGSNWTGEMADYSGVTESSYGPRYASSVPGLANAGALTNDSSTSNASDDVTIQNKNFTGGNYTNSGNRVRYYNCYFTANAAGTPAMFDTGTDNLYENCVFDGGGVSATNGTAAGEIVNGGYRSTFRKCVGKLGVGWVGSEWVVVEDCYVGPGAGVAADHLELIKCQGNGGQHELLWRHSYFVSAASSTAGYTAVISERASFGLVRNIMHDHCYIERLNGSNPFFTIDCQTKGGTFSGIEYINNYLTDNSVAGADSGSQTKMLLWDNNHKISDNSLLSVPTLDVYGS